MDYGGGLPPVNLNPAGFGPKGLEVMGKHSDLIKPDGMLDRHWEFCLAYMKNPNATAAYMEVYPDASVESAGTAGHRLLQSDEIQSVMQTYWRNRAMGVDELFYHLAEIARGIPAEYYHSDGRLNFEKLKRDGKTQLVAGITENRNGRSFKLQDRQRALEMIGRGMGAFMDAKNEGVQEIIVTLQGLTQQPPPPAISASSPPALGGGDTAVEGEYTDGD
jgi:phage terminase small subunit